MRITGVVKWFDDTKGFGFLVRDDGGKDVFVHRSGIAGSGDNRRMLVDGQRVEFEVAPGRSGKPAAVNVTTTAPEPAA